MIKPEDMTNAIGRIALTADGELLYRWLQKELQRIGLTAEGGALWMLEGRRHLAHDLMQMMAKGIDERANRTGPDLATEQPVAFARPEPVAVSRTRGAARRITAGAYVAGWDPPER